MKLTEKRIKQIILEEIQSIYEEEMDSPQEEPLEKKDLPDVDKIKQFLPKIDHKMEYKQLVSVVMGHDFGDDNQKLRILKDLRDAINTILSKGIQ